MTAIKICGLRTRTDVEAAVAAGADMLGFVLAEGSPRQVGIDDLAALTADLPADVETVAVYATAPAADTLRALSASGIDAVQADAPFRLPVDLHDRLGALPSLRDGDRLIERTVSAVAFAGRDGRVLIDGPRGGGRGELADHRRVAAVAWRARVLLAGGLDPDNVGAAIRHVRPFGVDVSSGVESARGIKDPARIRAFCAAVRAADRETVLR